ncbi:hypothetical protein HPB52_015573 [Rhipicephalus sanguineus]|uniref:Caspase n=1 Tax=Rhipicephalus sanguineus TaxID=34632 RepID=A0A9D4SPD6_RHISA|nr:hypothetical protein HPB52_015573 [Rhipicephalus sanguineus]
MSVPAPHQVSIAAAGVEEHNYGSGAPPRPQRNHYQDSRYERRFSYPHGKQDYSDDDCFVCCFLTHGGHDHLYGTDGKFSVNDIVEPFLDEACPSLIGKPKLFFIQACRGDRLDSGAQVVFDTADSPTWSYKIPDHPDILVACCTVPGFYAWRNKVKGSWFIQALCSVLEELAGSVDLLSMLTVVNRRVALEHKSYTPKNPHMCCKKQVPSFTSTLIRRVCFRQN